MRHFWDQKNLHKRTASFHIVVTSYQMIVTDFKYFNRIKWQYMILDEAQAIKSSSSQRWKMLLQFRCRNRLLLSGTPIQNSMAELWSLLHFVMPTLFDSHEEFNDWFSKDIESSAESKSQVDESKSSFSIKNLHILIFLSTSNFSYACLNFHFILILVFCGIQDRESNIWFHRTDLSVLEFYFSSNVIIQCNKKCISVFKRSKCQ